MFPRSGPLSAVTMSLTPNWSSPPSWHSPMTSRHLKLSVTKTELSLFAQNFIINRICLGLLNQPCARTIFMQNTFNSSNDQWPPPEPVRLNACHLFATHSFPPAALAGLEQQTLTDPSFSLQSTFHPELPSSDLLGSISLPNLMLQLDRPAYGSPKHFNPPGPQ